MSVIRTRATVTVPRTDGQPDDVYPDAPAIGVWAIVRERGSECWTLVHRPTGRTLWRVRSAEVGLAMLDELGAVVPDWDAGRSLLDPVETTSRESHLARAIVLEMAAEDMAIEAVSNMDGHEAVDVFCVTNATVESQRGGE